MTVRRDQEALGEPRHDELTRWGEGARREDRLAVDRSAASGRPGSSHWSQRMRTGRRPPRVQAGREVMARPLWIANQAVRWAWTVGVVHAPETGRDRARS